MQEFRRNYCKIYHEGVSEQEPALMVQALRPLQSGNPGCQGEGGEVSTCAKWHHNPEMELLETKPTWAVHGPPCSPDVGPPPGFHSPKGRGRDRGGFWPHLLFGLVARLTLNLKPNREVWANTGETGNAASLSSQSWRVHFVCGACRESAAHRKIKCRAAESAETESPFSSHPCRWHVYRTPQDAPARAQAMAISVRQLQVLKLTPNGPPSFANEKLLADKLI